MDSKAIKEVFNELFTHLERLETESAATLQFLKEKKRVTDKQLAPYLEQAGNAANVKWRAARVRIERLLSDEEEGEKKIEKKPEIAQAEQKQTPEQSKEQGEKKQTESRDQAAKEQSVKGQSEDQPKTQSVKEQADKNQIASPELEAAVNRDIKQEPKHEEPKHEEANHPTEMTQEAAQRDSGKPADEMKPKDADKSKEAA